VTLRRVLPAVVVLAVVLPTVGGAWWHADQRLQSRLGWPRMSADGPVRDFNGAALGVPIGRAMGPLAQVRGKVSEPGN